LEEEEDRIDKMEGNKQDPNCEKHTFDVTAAKMACYEKAFKATVKKVLQNDRSPES